MYTNNWILQMVLTTRQLRTFAGILGLSGVTLFSISLIVFALLHPTFSLVNDFVSKLGGKGEPYALWWNLIGFVFVGMLLMMFGFAYGGILKDRLTGICLALFGMGFAFTAIPVDIVNSDSPLSKAHIVAICLALAFWLFGLARISYLPFIESRTRRKANIAAILIVSGIVGFALGLWSMPLTHRWVFLVVFGWTAITAIELLANSK